MVTPPSLLRSLHDIFALRLIKMVAGPVRVNGNLFLNSKSGTTSACISPSTSRSDSSSDILVASTF